MATNVLVCRVSTFRAVRKPIVIAITGVTILLSGCGGGASQSELARARQEGAQAQAQKESIKQHQDTQASVSTSESDPQPSAEPAAPAPAQLLEVGQSVEEGYMRLTLMTRQSPNGKPYYFVVIEALSDSVPCPLPEQLYSTSAGERMPAAYQPGIKCEVLNQGEHSTTGVIMTGVNSYTYPDMKLVFAPGGQVVARWTIPA